VYTRLIPSTDPRLGRHVSHDDRSLRFAAPVLPRSALQAQQWTRRCPVLDQGRIRSCTGNAAAVWVGTDNTAREGNPDVDEALALDLYHWATVLDEFDGEHPPTDTGSSGLGAAKALKRAGYCISYLHAFTLRALATVLQAGPALIGIPWHESMYDPHADGRIPVNTASPIAGGHELIVDGYAPMNDPAQDRYWITNSWGESWGQDGRAYLTGVDLALLLADDGDATAPTVAAAAGDADVVLAAVLHPWIATRHTGSNATAARAAGDWLTAKGL
jgi:hypothetical protein